MNTLGEYHSYGISGLEITESGGLLSGNKSKELRANLILSVFMVQYLHMKTTILIATILLSATVYASSQMTRVETTDVYGAFQDSNNIKVYKFKDGDITCYGQVYKSTSGIISSQALSCVK